MMNTEQILTKFKEIRLFSYLSKNKYISKIIKGIVKTIFFLDYKTQAIIEYLKSIPRALGYDDPKYQKLKLLKDKYKGKRLFITCTGPSLTIEDLESLENEYVFGMNSIALIHDKTKWKPDFYGIQDRNVYDRIKDSIWSTDNGMIFMPHGYRKNSEVHDDVVFFHICGSYHLFEYRYKTKEFAKFSGNAYAKVYDGYSITISIMQLAIYMGFDEIYLIGADCTYLKDKQHFIEHGNVELQLGVADRMIIAYQEVQKYADSNNIKIFNATRGGCLEVFPRVNLDHLLREPTMKNKKGK